MSTVPLQSKFCVNTYSSYHKLLEYYQSCYMFLQIHRTWFDQSITNFHQLAIHTISSKLITRFMQLAIHTISFVFWINQDNHITLWHWPSYSSLTSFSSFSHYPVHNHVSSIPPIIQRFYIVDFHISPIVNVLHYFLPVYDHLHLR